MSQEELTKDHVMGDIMDQRDWDTEELSNQITTMNKLSLANWYERVSQEIEDLEAEQSVIKEELASRMDTDSEEIGEYLCLFMNKNEYPELSLEKARELGLTKVEEKINTPLVTKAYKNGVDLGKVEKKRIFVMRKKKLENGGEE